jgi:hypothetical protein
MLTNQDHQATPLNFTSLDTLLRLGTDWLSFEAPWGFRLATACPFLIRRSHAGKGRNLEDQLTCSELAMLSAMLGSAAHKFVN